MFVQKRDYRLQRLDLEKVRHRLDRLVDGMGFLRPLDKTILDTQWMTEHIRDRLYENVPTAAIDEQVAQLSATMNTKHPDFGTLASRVAVNNLHKETNDKFSEAMEHLYENFDADGNHSPLIHKSLYRLVKRYAKQLDQHIVHALDYELDYFGFTTLSKSYLLRRNDRIVERPQYMWMRVSLAIHENDLDAVFRSYHYMSNRYFTHATPTLFHAGTPNPQLSSCFLLGTGDSVKSIYKTVSDVAQISKWAGGIGVHLSNIRASGSVIRSTGRLSDGIVPLLRVLNTTARYINQSGRRNGSFAIYLEPWHADIQAFLEAKRNVGNEEERARDLFYALWIPDLFMERVERNETWSLMCPDQCKELTDLYGDAFRTRYCEYEERGMYIRQLPARELFQIVVNSQIETGTPYMLYKDACNLKSNQKNLGTIRSSNLCAEIVEYSDDSEYAVCNLASIALPQFVTTEDSGEEETDDDASGHPSTDEPDDTTIRFDHELLGQVVGIVVENLDMVIDKNKYPTPETELSNSKHRPMGVGVQGLADLYIKMGYPFESDEASALNREVFETIYYYALKRSCELARKKGVYESFKGSPLDKGQFQFDLWREHNPDVIPPTSRYDWDSLRQDIQRFGVRNSQLVALMPTASTSQILGCNECFEPYTSNLYVRRTLAGEFTVINRHLIRDLIKRNIWTEEVREQIFRKRGSVQGIEAIPESVQELYKTAWEISQKRLLEQAAERGPYVCQSQSLNLFLRKPSFTLLYSVHMYGWKLGLKTGSYYIRTAPAADMQAFTLRPEAEGKSKNNKSNKKWVCHMEEGCEMCSG